MAQYEKRGYLLENFRLFHLRSETGEQVDFHYHEFCKILLLVSGQGSYYVEGHRYPLIPGDIVLIGSRSVHKPELEAGVPYERIIIYISPEFLQQLSTVDSDLLSVFSGGKGHVLRPKESQRRKLFGIAAALEQDLSQPGFGREILSSSDLARLVVEMGRNPRSDGGMVIEEAICAISASTAFSCPWQVLESEFFICLSDFILLERDLAQAFLKSMLATS